VYHLPWLHLPHLNINSSTGGWGLTQKLSGRAHEAQALGLNQLGADGSPAILATREAEIRRAEVQGQPGHICSGHETPSQKEPEQNGLEEGPKQ
jgi:hypothetical protein